MLPTCLVLIRILMNLLTLTHASLIPSPQDHESSSVLQKSSATSLRDHDPLTDSAQNIPGVAGIDYPIFNEVPPTKFDCLKQRYKGFFADITTKCQAWHYCDFSDGQSTFLCPNGTVFSQILLTCDWWFNVNCHEAEQQYVLNEALYRLVKPHKPTFPEDFHGPEVDLWLKRQLQLGKFSKMI